MTQEAIELRVNALPHHSRFRRGLEDFTSFIFRGSPNRRVVILRPDGMRGPITPTEAVELEWVRSPLTDQIAQNRRPLLAAAPGQAAQFHEGSYKVELKKEPWKWVAKPIDFFSSTLGKIIRNVPPLKLEETGRFEKSLSEARAQHINVAPSRYVTDSDVVSAAQHAVQLLTHRRIPVTLGRMQDLIGHRAEALRKKLDKRGVVERIVGLIGLDISTAASLPGKLFGVNLVQFERDIAEEEIRYRAVSKRNPDVKFLGLLLGLVEFGIGRLADKSGLVALDEINDFIIGGLYKHIKYPSKKVLGQRVEHKAIDRLILATEIAPLIPVIPTLWVAQMSGKRRLRELLNANDPQAYRELINAAYLGVMADFQKQNRLKR